MTRWMSFGEYVNNLISGKNKLKCHNALSTMVSNEIAIGLDMFGALINRFLFVIIKSSGTRLNNTNILQQSSKPKKLISSIYNNSIFCFGVRVITTVCFLLHQKIKESPKENKIQ